MIIPVALFFDRNYLIPAAVAITSLLRNADTQHSYHIHVFHNGLSGQDISRLTACVSVFPNAKFFHRDMKDYLSGLFEDTKIKGHYSKEMYYKFMSPSLLKDYDKAIITDADVVFCGDVAKTFSASILSSDTLVSGCKVPVPKGSWVAKTVEAYSEDFTVSERERLIVGGGYLVFNLEAMREEKIEDQLTHYARENVNRVRQPEQDVICLVCHPRIEVLPIESMICSYCYDLFLEPADFDNAEGLTSEEVKAALENPIQLHFATRTKPWNTPNSTKSEVWHEYLFRTPFSKDYLDDLSKRTFKEFNIRRSMKLPFSKAKYIGIFKRFKQGSA